MLTGDPLAYSHAEQHFCHQEQGIGSNEQRWLVTTIHNNKSVSQCYQAKATVDFAENLQTHSPLCPSKPADKFDILHISGPFLPVKGSNIVMFESTV